MSPASGDNTPAYLMVMEYLGFHSINVPSEWGPEWKESAVGEDIIRFHSINVPSEWGPYLCHWYHCREDERFPFN